MATGDIKLAIKDIKLSPKNPRIIKDYNFKKLVQDLKNLPVMTELREVILDENKVIIAGNMRYRAAIEAGWTEIPIKIFTRDDAKRNNELTGQSKTYEEYIEEITIKDNLHAGDWDYDVLANEYDNDFLKQEGLGLPEWEDDPHKNDPKNKNDKTYQGAVIIVADRIEDIDKLTDFYNLEAVDITEDIKNNIMVSRKAYIFRQ